MSNEGKVAVVTGAGTGVGRAAAIALLNEGYSVTLAGRRLEPLHETAAMADDPGDRALAVSTDVSDEASVKAMFAATLEAYGRVDVIFNNAGISALALPFDELPVQTWREVVDINLTGVFLCAQEAYRIMKAQTPQGGRIINNGSISAQVPRLNSAAYTSTKHAITGLTKSIALDGRSCNVACGQIDIGNAASPMTARMPEGVLQADGSKKAEPVMDSEHVGNAIVHMAGLPLDANILTMTIMATKMP
ncbi:MAG: SDR family oxidoreductase, partial [Rhizobiales bacterium]|nr:SDR family oxidoreductase [Hyphomicrobiales bacterium]